MQDYRDRFNNLRKMTNDMALPRLRKIHRDNSITLCGKKYPKCETLEQWLNEYRLGVYNNDKRWMVNRLCNEVWGKECIPSVEKMVMNRLKIKYVHQIIKYVPPKAYLEKPKTNRACGSLRKNFSRLTQTHFTERFR